ncbi:MAG: hypothetical protein ACI8PZ_007258 [Myxococcota bacterium]|jgi:hypothetical protein
MADPYDVLGVSPDASADDLKRAWRTLAREWHPDRNPSPEAPERFRAIADAWAVLSDPVKRSQLDRRQSRVRHGDLPEEFLLDVADAVERAEAWIVGSVLPHYVGLVRGTGAEAAARMWHDLESLATPGPLPSRGSARQVRRWLGRIEVTLITEMAPHPTVLLRHREFWEIAVTPAVLWHAGVRDGSALDAILMRALLSRFAQVASHGRFVPTDAVGEAEVAGARQRDDLVVRRVRARWLGWSLIALLLLAMFVAGAQGW